MSKKQVITPLVVSKSSLFFLLIKEYLEINNIYLKTFLIQPFIAAGAGLIKHCIISFLQAFEKKFIVFVPLCLTVTRYTIQKELT